MAKKHPDHRHGIVQAVRVMADVRLVKDGDPAVEGLVTPLDDRRVLAHRNKRVQIADNMDQRNPGPGKRCKVVDGILTPGKRFRLILESVALDQRLPVGGTSLCT